MFGLRLLSLTTALLTCWSYAIGQTRAELFSSLIAMSDLIDTSDTLVQSLDHYLLDIELELNETYPFVLLMPFLRQIPKNNSRHFEKFIANPINAFLLIKRLTIDWQNVKNILNYKRNGESLIKQIESSARFPAREDLLGAEEALTRLQKTYALDIDRLSNGIITYASKKSSQITHIWSDETDAAMNFDDCYEIGEYYHEMDDNENALEWMRISWHKLEDEMETIANRQHIQISILENLAYYSYLVEQFELAVRYNEQILAIDSSDKSAIENDRVYRQESSRQWVRERRVSTERHLESNGFTPVNEYTFYRICRGDHSLDASAESRLVCHFLDTSLIPYCRLWRVRVEIKHIDPDIRLYHDIISDTEIDVLKSLAASNLIRGQTQSGNVTAAVRDRTVKIAWLSDRRHVLIERLSRRVGLITGMNMDSSESLQIGNYGIGGHFVPHVDAGPDGRYGSTTERVATWMFYLSDVEAGGDTAFVSLNVTSPPIKGSALFWHNLLRSGQLDKRTMHAGCPVLVGNKWIANKWIHAVGQEFRHKCSLNEHE